MMEQAFQDIPDVSVIEGYGQKTRRVRRPGRIWAERLR